MPFAGIPPMTQPPPRKSHYLTVPPLPNSGTDCRLWGIFKIETVARLNVPIFRYEAWTVIKSVKSYKTYVAKKNAL
jgi:hypothetical protein